MANDLGNDSVEWSKDGLYIIVKDSTLFTSKQWDAFTRYMRGTGDFKTMKLRNKPVVSSKNISEALRNEYIAFKGFHAWVHPNLQRDRPELLDYFIKAKSDHGQDMATSSGLVTDIAESGMAATDTTIVTDTAESTGVSDTLEVQVAYWKQQCAKHQEAHIIKDEQIKKLVDQLAAFTIAKKRGRDDDEVNMSAKFPRGMLDTLFEHSGIEMSEAEDVALREGEQAAGGMQAAGNEVAGNEAEEGEKGATTRTRLRRKRRSGTRTRGARARQPHRQPRRQRMAAAARPSTSARTSLRARTARSAPIRTSRISAF